MANPIQDWLDKFKKTTTTTSTTPPKSKVKASSGLGTGPTPGASAGAGTGPTSTATVKAGEEFLRQHQLRQKQEEALKKKTHQQLINAAYKVAENLKLKGGPWPLLRAAGWGHLTDNRGALYSGPFIDDLEKLTPEVKAALKKELGL